MKKIHGMDGKPIYNAWRMMRYRCTNPNHPFFADYGGRGISVHPEWMHDFCAFYVHMGDKPTPAHELDRIDNNGNYVPGNVRWATRTQQIRNRRTTRLTESQVRDIKLFLANGALGKDLAVQYGINKSCVSNIKSGKIWSDVTVTAPQAGLQAA